MTELVAYADLGDDPLVRAALSGDREGAERALFAEPGGLSGALARRVLASSGPFARAARAGLVDDARRQIAAAELDRFGAAARGLQLRIAGTADPAGLAGRLASSAGWGRHAGDLAAFHQREGVGALAVNRVLRVDAAGLHGIVHADPIGLADLVGREELRTDLLADIEAFTSGEPANDALLYGPPGTGKSATVRASAAAFADRGLRLIQVAHDELEHIDAVFEAVSGTGPWCLLFLDDLVFDDASRADRALRAALEGGVVARPRNVLVWATSNRLNMTHTTHSERADEIDESEARGEKTALAKRFGRRVRFDLRGEDWYLEIALRLVGARLGRVPEGTDVAALRYCRTGAGPSPRTAHHFAAQFRP